MDVTKQHSQSRRASRAPHRRAQGRSEPDPGGWRDDGPPGGSAQTESPAKTLIQQSYLLVHDFRDAVSPPLPAAPLLRAAPSAAGMNGDHSPQESRRGAQPLPSPEHPTTFQAKAGGLVKHNHNTNPPQPKTNSAAVMPLSPDGHGKESQLNARDGTAGPAPAPHLALEPTGRRSDPHVDPRDAFWG